MDLEQITNRRSPSQQRSRVRVNMILATARTLIEEKGIRHLTVSEIAKRANTSMGSIYQYFSNKEAIILSLAEFFMEQIRDITDNNLLDLHTGEDLQRFLSKNFEDIYQLHKNEPALRQIWFDSITPELNRLAINDCQINADRIYNQLLIRFQPVDKTLLRRFILMMCTQFGTVMRLCFQSDEGTPEQFRDIFVDMMTANVPLYLQQNSDIGRASDLVIC